MTWRMGGHLHHQALPVTRQYAPIAETITRPTPPHEMMGKTSNSGFLPYRLSR